MPKDIVVPEWLQLLINKAKASHPDEWSPGLASKAWSYVWPNHEIFFMQLVIDEAERLRNAVKLIIGRHNNVPWREVPDVEVDGYLDELARLEAASAAGGE